jgi:hypothetical protein
VRIVLMLLGAFRPSGPLRFSLGSRAKNLLASCYVGAYIYIIAADSVGQSGGWRPTLAWVEKDGQNQPTSICIPTIKHGLLLSRQLWRADAQGRFLQHLHLLPQARCLALLFARRHQRLSLRFP